MPALDTGDLLQTLFLAAAPRLASTTPDARVLFFGARAGSWISEWPGARFTCEQGFRPFADELQRAGVAPGDGAAGGRFPLVLVLPPRQRDEARAMLARAVREAGPGGVVVACQANNEGARALEADLARLAGPVESLSRRKCRAVRTAPLDETVDASLRAAWEALDAVRPILDGRHLSRPGLFAWDRIDPGSALLAAHLPATLAGDVADLGAGWGYLASEIVRRCVAVTRVDLYEAARRALEPAHANLVRAVQEAGRAVEFTLHWHDATRALPRSYDAIVSNPPFHQGRADEPALGRAFIATAAAALRPQGALWLVANRHLPYEAMLDARFAAVREVAVAQGYKVVEAREPRP